MPQGPCDDELIRGFVEGGDRAAFERLVRRHTLQIRRLLYGLFAGNREDMEDAEQEVIIALFRSLPRFGFRSSFSTFLYRLTRNRAIDLIRRRERERRSLRRLADGVPPVPSGHPEDIAIARIARGRALALLATLGEQQRSVVLLREVEGLSLEEIAPGPGRARRDCQEPPAPRTQANRRGARGRRRGHGR